MNNQEAFNKEEVILRAVKNILTRVVKDTATPPELKHPLQDDTILAIRDCLGLITEREQELAQAAGREMGMRPKFTDEPAPQGEVIIPLHKTGLINKDKK
ncbi:MAG: segregation and condensation protein A [Gammaproteobacteria bacterium]|nr:segregation and condensation protein A [Gammaproteobacteria bacterium]MCK5091139.1 segregation and condensation protein A [Gammaproteobacteria bacterium]